MVQLHKTQGLKPPSASDRSFIAQVAYWPLLSKNALNRGANAELSDRCRARRYCPWEATPASTYNEVEATERMIELTEARFDRSPKRLIASTQRGLGV